MIKIYTDSNGVQHRHVVAGHQFGRRARFDRWGTHGSRLEDYPSFESASGHSYWGLECVLKDGKEWFYLGANIGPNPAAHNVEALVTGYQVIGHPGNWVGEGMNAIALPTIIYKFIPADFFAFLANN